MLEAAELFQTLTALGPRQTLCAARVRPVEGGARVDLEVAWSSPSGDCLSGLGTLDLHVAGGRVTALTLDLDVDPSVERAALALRSGVIAEPCPRGSGGSPPEESGVESGGWTAQSSRGTT